jgi:exodeoxyribonuclease-3
LPEEREMLKELTDWGLHDSYRTLFPEKNDEFSWFDYRSKGFEDTPKRGLRIDHIWVTKKLNAKIKDCGIDYDIRGMDKPSDHAPIWTLFDL